MPKTIKDEFTQDCGGFKDSDMTDIEFAQFVRAKMKLNPYYIFPKPKAPNPKPAKQPKPEEPKPTPALQQGEAKPKPNVTPERILKG